MEDRVTVSFDFKLSKNYNSVGGQISYSSDIGPEEDRETAYQRVKDFALEKIGDLQVLARKALNL